MNEPASDAARSRRQAQAAERREQLLTVALDLFAEKGFRGSTMRDIAQAAGVTEGLIYHYFPSKSALLDAVIERFNVTPEMVSLIRELKDVPVRDALIRAGQRFLELLTRNRTFSTLVITDAQRDPEMARVFREICQEGLETMLEFLRVRIAAGELRPHDPAASLRLLHGSVVWYFLTGNQFSPPLPPVDAESFVQNTVDLLIAGLSAAESGAESAR